MRHPDLHSFADSETLAHALAAAVAEHLEAAIGARGEASLVVSGGNTPRRLFTALRQAQIDWSAVLITLADERWVDVDQADSNERLVREVLLQERAAGARFIGLKTAADTPQNGVAECRSRLERMPRPFDVVLLGLGNDGHTASWFPGAPGLNAALEDADGQLCVAVHPVDQPQARISLTAPALCTARWLALHIEGGDKRQTLDRLLAADAVEQMPARALWSMRTHPPAVYWCP